MFALLYLLSLFLCGGCDALSSDDFTAREAASARLRSWRLAALPVLYRAESDADPEVRRRAREGVDAVLRPFPMARRLPPLWQAWRLIYEPGDCTDPVDLDPWQQAELRDGGAALWLEVVRVAHAEQLIGKNQADSYRATVANGTYGPWDAREALFRLRQKAAGLDDMDLP